MTESHENSTKKAAMAEDELPRTSRGYLSWRIQYLAVLFCLVLGFVLALVYTFHKAHVDRATTEGGAAGDKKAPLQAEQGMLSVPAGKVTPADYRNVASQKGSKKLDMKLPELTNSGKPLVSSGDGRRRAGVFHIDGPGPLICVVSSSATLLQQFPKQYCTHLVFSDVHYNVLMDKFEPVNDVTFKIFETMSVTVGLKLFVAMGGLTLQDLARSSVLAQSFTRFAARWLTARNLHGIALLGCSCASEQLSSLKPALEVVYKGLSASKLEIIVGMSITDSDTPGEAVGRRLSDIAPFVTYMVLQTHYAPRPEEKCRTVFPSVMYPQTKTDETVSIASSLAWMTVMLTERDHHGFTCFSLSMSALVYRGSSGPRSRCDSVVSENIMKVCDPQSWKRVDLNNSEVLVEMAVSGTDIEFHEGGNTLPVKVSQALVQYPLACIALFDVDQEDYEGACGEPYARLQSVRKAQAGVVTKNTHPSGKVRGLENDTHHREFFLDRLKLCMPPGKEYAQPLVCILSDRTDIQRTVTKQFCTHIVLSIRNYGPDLRKMEIIHPGYLAGFNDSNAKLILAIDKSVLLSQDGIQEQVDYIVMQLKGRNLDGLALLYVSKSSRQLQKLSKRLEVIHAIFRSNSLCLLVGIELTDYEEPVAWIADGLQDVSKHVDLLITQTHYPGNMGLCQAVPTSSFVQPSWSCIPRVAIETSLYWMRSASVQTMPHTCFSVDMRVLRYDMQGLSALEEYCYSEYSVDFGKACMEDGWTFSEDNITMTVVGKKGNMLQSFDSVMTLQRKVTTALKIFPTACVAVFNYDYEDWQGNCHARPYARIEAITKAMGTATSAVEEVSATSFTRMPGPAPEKLVTVPPPFDVEASMGQRPLVCVLSWEQYLDEQVPRDFCTHLVHLGAVFEFPTNRFIVPDSIWRQARSRLYMKHFIGFDNARIDQLTYTGAEAGNAFAEGTAPSLRAHKFRGIAILNINRTSRSAARLGLVLKAMRNIYENRLSIILGLEIVDASVPPSAMALRMADIFKYSDLVVFQTHYRRPAGYCKVSYPSTYSTDHKTSTVPLANALEWIRLLDQDRYTCISFTLAVLEFAVPKLTNVRCVSHHLVPYESICPHEGWTEVANISGSFCNARYRGNTWQAYETAELLSAKVARGLGRYPLACVALFNVDYEDYRQACPERGYPFGRLAAVNAEYKVLRSAVPVKKEVLPDIKKSRPYHYDREGDAVVRDTPRPDLPGNSTVYCFLSAAWSDVGTVPRDYCTHIVFHSLQEAEDPVEVQALIREAKNQSRPDRKHLLSLRRLPEQDLVGYANKVARVLVDLDLDGVALVDLHLFSTSLHELEPKVKVLRQVLLNQTIVLGVEIADFTQGSATVSDGIEPLLTHVDAFIVQTHYRRYWKFCRTAAASTFQEPRNACLQTTPVATALKWMQIINGRGSRVPLCLSFNLAALKFHYAGKPMPGSFCSKVSETSQICEVEGWAKEEDANYSMTAFRYKQDRWVSLETEELLRMKVELARSAYPKLCLAAFNVDYDSGTESCSPQREPFARLKRMTAATASRTEVEPLGTGKFTKAPDKPADDHAAIGRTPGVTKGILICVIEALHVKLVPAQMCDIAVYTGVVYDQKNITLRALKEDALSSFKALHKEQRARLAVGLQVRDLPLQWAASPRLMSRFVANSTSWLRENDMSGIVLLVTQCMLRSDPFLPSVEALVRNFKRFKREGSLDVIVCLPSVKELAGVPRSIFRNSDFVILATHRVLPEARCHIRHPSTTWTKNGGFGFLDASRAMMVMLQGIMEDPSRMCFSVNLAVLSFALPDPDTDVGQECLRETIGNFAQTCLTTSSTNLCDYQSISCSLRNASHLVLFEDEETVQTKVEYMRKLFPEACVAAFHVDMEDHEGVCPTRRPFSRLTSIRQALRTPIPEQHKEISVRSHRAVPRSLDSGRMVCVLSQHGYSLKTFPTNLCTHLVYSSVEFAYSDRVITPTNVSSFKDFLSLKNSGATQFLVALNILRLRMADDVVLNVLAAAMSKWLLQNGINGVALLTLSRTEVHVLLDVLKALRNDFVKNDIGHLLRIVGLPLMRNENVLKQIDEYADIIVVMNHKEEGPYCGPRLPVLNSFGDVDLMRTSRLAALLSHNDTRSSRPICPTISLAVLQTSQELPKSQCREGIFVTYAKACPTPGSPAFIAEGSTNAYRRFKDTLQVFETEESLTAKVSAALKFWPLSCIAAFYVDYEDFDGECETKEPLSRIKQLSRLLGIAPTTELEQRPAAPKPRHLVTPQERSRKLLCLMWPEQLDLDKFPVELCDYLVLTDLQLPKKDYVSAEQQRVFMKFLAMRDTTGLSLAVGIDILALMKTYDVQIHAFLDILEGYPSWLVKNRLDSLVFLVTKQWESGIMISRVFTNAAIIKRHIEKLPGHRPKLMIVMPLPDAHLDVAFLSNAFDTIILLEYGSVPERICRLMTSSSGRHEIRRTQEKMESIISGISPMYNVRTCFAINLGVVRLKSDIPSASPTYDSCNAAVWAKHFEPCTYNASGTYFRLDNVMAYHDVGGVMCIFEDEVTVSSKVISMVARSPISCAAVMGLYAEHRSDKNGSIESFPRLKTLRKALDTPVSSEGDKHTYSSKQPAARRKRRRPMEAGVMVCVISRDTSQIVEPPDNLCDYLVYECIAVDFERLFVSLSGQGPLFNDFMNLRHRKDLKLIAAMDERFLPRTWVTVPDVVSKLAADAIEWLKSRNMYGIAALPTALHQVRRLEAFFRALDATPKGHDYRPFLILGMPVTLTTDIVTRYSDVADLVILYTHRRLRSDVCKIVHPSHYDEPSISPSMEVISDTVRKVEDVTQTTVCVSLTMAVYKFVVNDARSATFGDQCAKEEWSSFKDTCIYEGVGVLDDTLPALLLQRVNKTLMLAYEDSYSVEQKAEEFLRRDPSGCIGVFELEKENSEEQCVAPFSRVRKIRSVLDTKKDFDLVIPPQPARRVEWLPNRNLLVCVGLPGRKLSIYVASMCDYVVMKPLVYNPADSSIGALDNVSAEWDDVIERAKVLYKLPTCLTALVKEDSLKEAWLRNDSIVAQFAVDTERWLRKQGFCGIAVWHADSSLLESVIKQFWSQFSGRKPRPKLVAMVPPAEESKNLTTIANMVDVLVLLTHHSRAKEKCEIVYPSAQCNGSVLAEMMRIGELGEELHLQSHNATSVCFSTTMAVMRLKLDPRHLRTRDACVNETWVNYRETCSVVARERTKDPALQANIVYKKPHLMTYEDEKTIAWKAHHFLSAYRRGCVAAFELDFEDDTGSCRKRRFFSRLWAARATLDTHGGSRSVPERNLRPVPKSLPIVCIPSANSTVPKFLEERLCDYALTLEVSYDAGNDTIRPVAGAGLEDHRKAVIHPSTKRLLFLASESAESLWSQSNETIAAFADSTISLARQLSADGLALFSADSFAGGLGNVTKVIKERFANASAGKSDMLTLLVVASVNTTHVDFADLESVASYSDILVLMPRENRSTESCRKTYPPLKELNVTQFTDALARIGSSQSSKAMICPSSSMAVQEFLLQEGECTGATNRDYSEVCQEERYNVRETRTTKNGTYLRSWEDPEEMVAKVKTMLSVYNNTCLAVFDADYDDPAGTCFNASVPFYRMHEVWNAMRSLSRLQLTEDLTRDKRMQTKSKTRRRSITRKPKPKKGRTVKPKKAKPTPGKAPSESHSSATPGTTAQRPTTTNRTTTAVPMTTSIVTLSNATNIPEADRGENVTEILSNGTSAGIFTVQRSTATSSETAGNATSSAKTAVTNATSPISVTENLTSSSRVTVTSATLSTTTAGNATSPWIRIAGNSTLYPKIAVTITVSPIRTTARKVKRGEHPKPTSYLRSTWQSPATSSENLSTASTTVSVSATSSTGKPSHPGGRLLLCVFTSLEDIRPEFPSNLCTYLVYMNIVYDVSRNSIRPLSESKFLAFMRLASNADVLVVVGMVPGVLFDHPSTVVVKFMLVLSKWLMQYHLDGVAFFLPTTEHVSRLAVVTSIFRRQLSDQDHILVVGIPFGTTDRFLIHQLARDSDVFVFLTHHFEPSEHCRIRAPAQHLQYSDFQLMKEAAQSAGRESSTCFSVGLAVARFTLLRNRMHLGDVCNEENWENYGNVCNRTVRQHMTGAFVDEPKQMFAFENEETIAAKVKAFSHVLPSGCVAAFGVNFEDTSGGCAERPKHSRLSLLSTSLVVGHGSVATDQSTKTPEEQPPKGERKVEIKAATSEIHLRSTVPHRGTEVTAAEERPPATHSRVPYKTSGTTVAEEILPGKATADERTSTASGMMLKRKVFTSDSRPLVCIISGASSIPRHFPADLCTFLVYTGITYALDDAKIYATQDLAAFEALAGTTSAIPIAVLDHSPIVALIKEGAHDQMTTFLQDLTAWLSQNAMRGTALWSTGVDMKGFADVTSVLAQHFHEESVPRMLLLVGAPFAATKYEHLESLICDSDVFVFLAHRGKPSEPCVIATPSTHRLTYDDIVLVKHMQESPSVRAPICISVSMAVHTFALPTPNATFVDRCDEERWENYGKVCNERSERNYVAESAYQDNRTHIWAFEDGPTLKSKVVPFMREVPGGCVAAFAVEFEDTEGTCPLRSKHSRLTLLADLLSSPVAPVENGTMPAVNISILPRRRATRNRKRHAPSPTRQLVCTLSKVPERGRYPVELCSHLVFMSVAYEFANHSFYSMPELEAFLKMKDRNATCSLVAISASLERNIEQDEYFKDDFLRSVTPWLSQRALDGVAMFATEAERADRFAETVTHVWSHFKTMVSEMTLIVGVAYPEFGPEYVSVLSTLSRNSDLLIFFSHRLSPEEHCRLSFPNNHVFSSDDFLFMQSVAIHSPTCVAINMAVLSFKVESADKKFGDDCISERQESFAKVCGHDMHITDEQYMAVYSRRDKKVETFEDEETIAAKMEAFSRLHPTGCVAAFGTEYEDFVGKCPKRHKHSRLETVYNALHEQPGVLVCVLSTYMTHMPREFPSGVCTYIVYAYITYDGLEEQISPHDGVLFDAFLSEDKKGAIALVALQSTVLSDLVIKREAVAPFLSAMVDWLVVYSLRGVLIVPQMETRTSEAVEVLQEISKSFREVRGTVLEMVVGVRAPWKDVNIIKKIAEVSDLLIYVTHRLAPAKSCSLEIASPGWNVDIFKSEMHSLKRPGMPTVCLSLNMAVVSYELRGAAATYGDSCLGESWGNYAETCNKRTAEGAGWERVFENETTVENKTLAFLESYPKGCVAAFAVDMEDELGCNARSPYSRLQTLTSVLSRPKGVTEATGDGSKTTPLPGTSPEASKHAGATARVERAPLVCIFSPSAPLPSTFPNELCTYVVYTYVTYNTATERVSPILEERLQKFIALITQRKETSVVAISPTVLNQLDVSNKTVRSFARAVTKWLESKSLGGAAVFTTVVTDIAIFADAVQELWTCFRTNSVSQKRLLVGIQAAVSSGDELLRIANYADLLIILTLPLVSSATCRILPPSTANMFSGLFGGPLERPPGQVSAVCVSINLAVLTFKVKAHHQSFGESCSTETWANFAQTCPKNGIRTDVDYTMMSAYRKNGSYVQAFENDHTISHKLRRFRRLYRGGCAAAYYVDYEDSIGECESRDRYSRLVAISRLLSSAQATSPVTSSESTVTATTGKQTEETRVQEGSSKKDASSPQKGRSVLVCVFSSFAPFPPSFPQGVCEYVVYAYVNYYAEDSIVEASNKDRFEMFRQIVAENRAVSVAAVTPLALARLDVKDQDQMDEFVSAIRSWLDEKSLGGLAMFPTVPMAPSHFADCIDAISNSIRGTPVSRKQLLVGIRAPVQDLGALKRILLVSDLVVLLTFPLLLPGTCKILPPNGASFNTDLFTDAHRYSEMHHEATVCLAVNLAVRNFRLGSNKGEFGSSCISESWSSYAETCPLNGVRTDVDKLLIAGYRRNDSYFQAFETKSTLSKKLKNFTQIHLSGCLAAFFVNFEDWKGECSSRAAYSRLQAIVSALSRKPDPLIRSLHGSKPKGTAAVTDGTSLLSTAAVRTHKGLLICVLSSFGPLPVRFPQTICDYLVYAFISYLSDEDAVTPNNDERFERFQEIVENNSAVPLVALAPSLLSRLDIKDRGLMDEFEATLVRWTQRKALGGLALFDTKSSDMKRFEDLVDEIWNYMHKKSQRNASKKNLKLVVGVHASLQNVDTIRRLTESSDLLIILTLPLMPSTSCKVTPPSSPNIGPDFFKLINSHIGSHQTDICISVNLAVLNFELRTRDSTFGQDCVSETWDTFAQVCAKKDIDTKINNSSMTAYRKDGLHFSAFEDDATIASKVRAFRAVFPSACIAAFFVDLEDTTGACKKQYSRLKTIARLASEDNSLSAATETMPTISRHLDLRKRDRETKKKREGRKRRLLVCVLSSLGLLPARLPSDTCDYLVYSYVAYRFDERTVQPMDDTKFTRFQRMKPSIGARSVVAVAPSVWSRLNVKGQKTTNDFLYSVTSFIERNSLDGVAAFPTLATELTRFVKVVRDLWSSLHSNPSGFKFLVGIHAPAEKAPALRWLVKNSDVTILLTHRLLPTDPCKVTHPSIHLMTGDDYKTAAKNMATPDRVATPCVAINLAVLHFEKNDSDAKFGSRCVKETWDNYAETCPATDSERTTLDDSASSYRTGHGVMQTFETENSVAEKVLQFSESFPEGCVAAFNVDFEDTSGKCAARERYSRLKTIAAALNGA